MKLTLNMETKRKVYISLFTLFGLLFGIFITGFVEVIYIKLLLQDFITYSFGLSWDELNQYGQFFGLILTVACTAWGYVSGKYWWKQIYVLKCFRQKY